MLARFSRRSVCSNYRAAPPARRLPAQRIQQRYTANTAKPSRPIDPIFISRPPMPVLPEERVELPRNPAAAPYNAKLKALLEQPDVNKEEVNKLIDEMIDTKVFDGESAELHSKFIQQYAEDVHRAARQQAEKDIEETRKFPDIKTANLALQTILNEEPNLNKIKAQYEYLKRRGRITPGNSLDQYHLSLLNSPIPSRVEFVKEVESVIRKSDLIPDAETCMLMYKIFVKEGKPEEGIAYIRGLYETKLIDKVILDIFMDKLKLEEERKK